MILEFPANVQNAWLRHVLEWFELPAVPNIIKHHQHPRSQERNTVPKTAPKLKGGKQKNAKGETTSVYSRKENRDVHPVNPAIHGKKLKLSSGRTGRRSMEKTHITLKEGGNGGSPRYMAPGILGIFGEERYVAALLGGLMLDGNQSGKFILRVFKF